MFDDPVVNDTFRHYANDRRQQAREVVAEEDIAEMLDDMECPETKDQQRVRGEFFACLFEDIYANATAAVEFEQFLMKHLIRPSRGLAPGIGSALQSVTNQNSEFNLGAWRKVS